jgi:MFS family permease
MARSKGAISGLLLILLGIWGALIPFVGPSFDFAYTPDMTWAWTAARFWYEVLPGIVTVVGALLLLLSANRAVATLGAAAAAASGAWFVVGPILAPKLGIGALGSPIRGGGWGGILTSIALFFGLGAAILYVAATALGRLSVRGVSDVHAVERRHARRGRVAPVDDRRYEEPAAADPGGTPVYQQAPAGPPMTTRNQIPVTNHPGNGDAPAQGVPTEHRGGPGPG